jgi:hypothetical protein
LVVSDILAELGCLLGTCIFKIHPSYAVNPGPLPIVGQIFCEMKRYDDYVIIIYLSKARRCNHSPPFIHARAKA